MSSPYDAVAAHAQAAGHQVRRGEGATHVTITARPDWDVEITLLDDRLEWYLAVRARSTKRIAYSEFVGPGCDGPETVEAIGDGESEAIMRLVDLFARGELRVVESPSFKLFGWPLLTSSRLEIRVDTDLWREVWTHY